MVETHYLRSKIWSSIQHPYKHILSDYAYTTPAMPWVTTLEGVINSLVAANYPHTKEPVDTPADLPLVGNDLLDYRVVLDDGDGKAAGYRWEQREGDVAPEWKKIYDMDWGEDTILSNFLTKTNDTYVSKFGQDEVDENGDPVTGIMAGQYIYGGASANTNLTLFANSGDGVGPNTGFVQLGDNVRPITTNVFDLGTSAYQFKDGYFSGTLDVAEIQISGNTISTTNVGDAISFVDKNLVTTGSIETGNFFLNGISTIKYNASPALAPAAGFVKCYVKNTNQMFLMDSSGAEHIVGLTFTSTNDNRLVRTDGTSAQAIQESGIIINDSDEMSGIAKLTVDSVSIDAQTISTTDGDKDLLLAPNGTGSVVLPSIRFTSYTNEALRSSDATGNLVTRAAKLNTLGEIYDVTKLTVDNTTIDGNRIAVTNLNGNLVLAANGTGIVSTEASILPATSANLDLGAVASLYNSLFISAGINDGTNSITIATLVSFRNALTGATDGDSLFYDDATSTWLASNPDTEIDHAELSNLLEDAHTQYPLLIGRATGQILLGGIAASENLVLGSTSHATKGYVQLQDSLTPTTDASFSGSWQGLDLGVASLRFRNINMVGEAKGLRAENFLSTGLPSSSANNAGRLIFATDTGKLMVDTGLAFKAMGASKFYADVPFNGTETLKNVDVSSVITDARLSIIQLKDNNNDFENIYCTLKATSAINVRIETGIPLPVGSYRLIVIE